jgi:hypothetical protein
MSEICEYCSNGLSSKSNLLYHQKNNKKCIEIQKSKFVQVNCNLKDCEFCKKKFNTSALKKHLLVCKVKINVETELKRIEEENRISELEKINLEKERECENRISKIEREYENRISKIEREYENRISEKEKIILLKDEKIHELEIKISELQAYKNMYEKDHQVITTMAQQPKLTTNSNTNNNIINNLAVYDNKTITDRFTDVLSNIKPTDLYDGQESISRFIVPCLKNNDGTQMYKCTDYARGVYIKKDHHGNIIKDINGKNLVELIEPIASKKATELLNEDNNKRDKQRRLRYLRKYIETQYEEIENVRNNMKGYEIDSSSWKCQNNRIKMLENSINKHMEEQEELEKEGIDELDDEVCDDKLTDGVNDIKNMKKDSAKFSKKLSKLLT